jgi:SAM-dependent methyltransferase
MFFRRRRQPLAAVPAQPAADPPMPISERDEQMSGWRNSATGELFTGVLVTADDVVADIGCSDRPEVARFCAERGAHTILVDTNTEGLARLKTALSAVDPALLTFVDGQEAGIPLPDGAASVVVSTEVLEHVDDPAAFMAELVRIGRGGARYILSAPDPVAERLVKRIAEPGAFRKPNHVRIFEREEFTALVRDAGLVIERQVPIGFFSALGWILFWADWVDPETMQAERLDSWARTWGQVMDCKDGRLVKEILDSAMPKSQLIVARKP